MTRYLRSKAQPDEHGFGNIDSRRDQDGAIQKITTILSVPELTESTSDLSESVAGEPLRGLAYATGIFLTS